MISNLYLAFLVFLIYTHNLFHPISKFWINNVLFFCSLSSPTTQQSKDTQKFIPPISSYHTTITTTNSNNFNYRTCKTEQTYPRTIPNYLDEFKYGFPSNGLSSLSSNKCWMTGNQCNMNSKCVSCNMVIQSGSFRLTQLRKRGIGDCSELLKRIGVCKGMVSKREKSVLLQVFSKSLPSQWKDISSSLLWSIFWVFFPNSLPDYLSQILIGKIDISPFLLWNPFWVFLLLLVLAYFDSVQSMMASSENGIANLLLI